MKKIVAYHAYLFGEFYKDVIGHQFVHLLSSGLFKEADKIYIGVVDSSNKNPTNGVEWVKSWWSFTDKVEIVVYPENNELIDTLKWVRDYSAKNPDDYILFFHSKGITNYSLAVEDWRRYMQYFTVEKWRSCIQKLNEGYDCAGVLWNRDTVYGDYPHFSGAFFWVKASYINTLKHEMLSLDWRYSQEFWIGSNPDCKAFEFHNSRMNDIQAFKEGRSHYSVRYSLENYKNELS